MPAGAKKSPPNTRKAKIPHPTYTHSREENYITASVHHNTCEHNTHTETFKEYNTYTTCKRIKNQKKQKLKTFIKASERRCQRFFSKDESGDILSFRLIAAPLSFKILEASSTFPRQR